MKKILSAEALANTEVTAHYENRECRVRPNQLSLEGMSLSSPYIFITGRPIIIELMTESRRLLRLPAVIASAGVNSAASSDAQQFLDVREYGYELVFAGVSGSDAALLREFIYGKADRRSEERRQARFTIDVLYPPNMEGLSTVNVSKQGLFVKTDYPGFAGTPQTSFLRLALWLDHENSIIIDAVIAHHMDENRARALEKIPGIGLHIVAMTDDDRRAWETLRRDRQWTGGHVIG